MDGWMDGVVLIRCIERWMVFFLSFAVRVRWVATVVFQGVFWYPPEPPFLHFGLPPGPPAGPKMSLKTPKVGLGRPSFSHFCFFLEICKNLIDFLCFQGLEALLASAGPMKYALCQKSNFPLQRVVLEDLFDMFAASGHHKAF